MLTKNNKLRKFTAVTLITFVMFCMAGCLEDFVEVESPTGSTIVTIASASDNFNILTAALIKAGLSNGLNNNNSGQFTVFAPSDIAFVNYFNTLSASVLPPGSPAPGTLDEASVLNVINSLVKPVYSPPSTTAITPSSLAGIINYHIVSSRITAESISGSGQVFTANNNSRLSISKTSSGAIILNANGTNGGNVTESTSSPSNGVIHTTDKVLISPTLGSTLAFLGYTSTTTTSPVNYSTNPPTINGGTTSDTNSANFNLFAAAIRTSGMATVLFPNTSPLPDFTVFAPTDGALILQSLSLVPAVTDEASALKAINGDASVIPPLAPTVSAATLLSLVKYHVVSGRLVSTDLSNQLPLITLFTDKVITISIAGSTITVIDGNTGVIDPTVTVKDNLTNAGVVHTINGVLMSN
jgi:uncharacterized surface protein with fasciclin (FAS1) repeats